MKLLRSYDQNDVSSQTIGIATILGMQEFATQLVNASTETTAQSTFYVAVNKWDDAIRAIQTQDRLKSKSIYFQKAKYMERIGKLDAAKEAYEKSTVSKYSFAKV